MESQEKNDPVWELLEHASEAKPGPFFARNVIREVRLMEDSSGGFGESLLSFFGKRLLNTAIAAAAVVAVIAFFPGGETDVPAPALAQETASEVEATEFDPAMELDEVEYLGQLVVVNDPGQLTDQALADLFF
ncbi:MAG: hypothetical protein HRU46_02720 [Verrucomicrobiales bacterium]|nr:hypothetical protein [Verrucomicrobiales bacterium]